MSKIIHIPILLYHSIVNPNSASKYPNSISLPIFEKHLIWLKEMGYQSTTFSNLTNILENNIENINRKYILITFDDGLANNIENALPILTKHGFTAMIFAVVGRIGKDIDWGKSVGLKLADINQLYNWINAGCEVGSHTLTHPQLTSISPDRVQKEIIESKSILENLFSRRIDHFCYPYGAFDSESFYAVKSAGYKTACTVLKGNKAKSGYELALSRVRISEDTTFFRLKYRLSLLYDLKYAYQRRKILKFIYNGSKGAQMENTENYHIIVSGRVQMVGFRYFTAETAYTLGITGWVKNLPDSRVEIFASGEPISMKNFIDKVKIGPRMSLVEDIKIEKLAEPINTKTFSVKY